MTKELKFYLVKDSIGTLGVAVTVFAHIDVYHWARNMEHVPVVEDMDLPSERVICLKCGADFYMNIAGGSPHSSFTTANRLITQICLKNK